MKKTLLTCLMILMSVHLVYSQVDFGKLSPQTADFVRYSNVNVSQNIGAVNLRIPIYTFEDRDFNLPLSLVYISDGFNPERRSGTVGVNWFLNTGGMISREIYGAPDDFLEYFTPSAKAERYHQMGFRKVSERVKIETNDLYNLINLSLEKKQNCYDLPLIKTDGGKEISRDGLPDLFRFTFGDHSGNFAFTSDNNIIINKLGYKICVDSLSTQTDVGSSDTPNKSSISIITPNGYTYIFGGSIPFLEYSFKIGESEVYNNGIGPIGATILGWHLAKIIAPNGRVMSFKYKTDETKLTKSRSASPNDGKYSYSYMVLCQPILESITIPDRNLTISLSYSSSDSREHFYQNYEYGFGSYVRLYDHMGARLDSISIEYKTEKDCYKRSFELTYEVLGKWRFLKTFTPKGLSGYSFEYNHLVYPNIESFVVNDERDFWGYWKAHSLTGVIQKVKYPTNGSTSFVFEPHIYSKRVEYNTANFKDGKVFPKLTIIDPSDPLYVAPGGLRIKTIINANNQGDFLSKKDYYYVNNYSSTKRVANLSSSGILLHFPPFSVIKDRNSLAFKNDKTWFDNYNINDSHISYSNVVECNNDGSYIIYKFTDYNSNPDVFECKVKYNSDVKLTDNEIIHYINTFTNKSCSQSYKRGLLSMIQSYTNKDKCIKTETSLYRGINNGLPVTLDEFDNICSHDRQYTVGFRSIHGGCVSKKVFLENNPLLYKKTKFNEVLLTEKLTYNNYDFVSSSTIVNSSNDTIKNKYRYMVDNASVGDSVTIKMLQKNCLNSIIEETRYKNNILLSTSRNYYRIIEDTMPVIDNIQRSIGKNPLEKRIVFVEYDHWGNPLCVSKDGIQTIYLWAYNGQYPIAEVRNLNYNQVNSVLDRIGLGGIKLLSKKTHLSENTLLMLHNNLFLKNALTTFYSYKPFIGMVSKSNPLGLFSLYEYDEHWRLAKYSNFNPISNKRSLINLYKYNY